VIATDIKSVCVIITVAIIPMVYFFCIYKKHQEEGIAYVTAPRGKAEETAIRITAVIVPIVLIGAVVLMFTGNIEVHLEDTSFRIDADYWRTLEVDYSDIDTIEYHKDFDTGDRASGFGFIRLSMGTLRNDEFGYYTLYAYTGIEEYNVLEAGDKTLVIGMKDADETWEIYQAILEKMYDG